MQFFKKIKNIISTPLYQVAVILFLFEAMFTPSRSNGDTGAFLEWCHIVVDHGIGNIYKYIVYSVFNYPPLITYLLFIFGKFEGTAQNIDKYFYFFKIFGLVADFSIALLLVRLLKNEAKQILFFLLLVANPVFIYNSYCWGQVDGILSVLLFASFFFLYNKRLVWSSIFFILAFNFKVHALIFLPPLALMGLYIYNRSFQIKDIFASIAAAGAVQFCLLIPFILTGEVHAIIKSATGAVDFYPYITCNSFNFWAWFFPAFFTFWPDNRTWMNITLKHWGTFLFIIFYSLTLLPLLAANASKFYKKQNLSFSLTDLFLTFALVPLVFFYFNTQMHERFVHTTLIFTAGYAFATRRYWLFLVVCMAYFANMEMIMRFFNFSNYGVVIFTQYWGTSLYLLQLISLLYFLYRSFISKFTNIEINPVSPINEPLMPGSSS